MSSSPLGIAQEEAPLLGLALGAAADELHHDGPEPLVQYQDDPIGFAVRELGIPEHTIRWSMNPGYEDHSWDGTPDPIVAALEALARWENVGIESGTSTSKSFTLGWIYLWFIASWENARVFNFAPKEDQLRLYSWAEIDKHFWRPFKRLFPSAVKTDLRIRMVPGQDTWGVWGYPVAVRADEKVASRAKGQHAEHMLLVYEETQGIDPAVIEAGQHTSTAPHNLRIAVGNPDHQHDALHLFCEKPSVTPIRISALDFPNVVTGDHSLIPGGASRKSVEAARIEYGEGDRIFKAQVRGLSPEEAQDALIRMAWIREAVERYSDPAMRDGLPWLGVDVANAKGGDHAAEARGIGACCLECVDFPVGDGLPIENANQLGSKVAAEMALEEIDEMHVGVDPGGVGAGTVNEMKRLGVIVPNLNASNKPRERVDEDVLREHEKSVRRVEVFYNLRAQMWWQARSDLQHGRIALPDDPELHRDLVTPTWEQRDGKILVEKKEEIIKRLGRSPNKADAFVLGNFVRHRRRIEEEEELRAWDPEALLHESTEGRRVRSKPPVRERNVDPTILERIP